MFQTVPLSTKVYYYNLHERFLPCASMVRIVNLTEIGYDAFFEEIRNDTL